MDYPALDDIAYGIVADYLDEGPEYTSIADAVQEEYDYRATENEVAEVATTVRATLMKLRRDFNVV